MIRRCPMPFIISFQLISKSRWRRVLRIDDSISLCLLMSCVCAVVAVVVVVFVFVSCVQCVRAAPDACQRMEAAPCADMRTHDALSHVSVFRRNCAHCSTCARTRTEQRTASHKARLPTRRNCNTRTKVGGASSMGADKCHASAAASKEPALGSHMAAITASRRCSSCLIASTSASWHAAGVAKRSLAAKRHPAHIQDRDTHQRQDVTSHIAEAYEQYGQGSLSFLPSFLPSPTQGTLSSLPHCNGHTALLLPPFRPQSAPHL